MFQNNPNATVTTVAGAVTVLAAWGASLAGLDVPGYVASAFTTVVAAAILFVGRPKKPAA